MTEFGKICRISDQLYQMYRKIHPGQEQTILDAITIGLEDVRDKCLTGKDVPDRLEAAILEAFD